MTFTEPDLQDLKSLTSIVKVPFLDETLWVNGTIEGFFHQR